MWGKSQNTGVADVTRQPAYVMFTGKNIGAKRFRANIKIALQVKMMKISAIHDLFTRKNYSATVCLAKPVLIHHNVCPLAPMVQAIVRPSGIAALPSNVIMGIVIALLIKYGTMVAPILFLKVESF